MAYDRELADRIRATVAGEDGVTERVMFGGLAFFVNGNMAVTATRRGGLMVRSEPSEVEALLAQPETETITMQGREMKGWVHVLTDGIRSDAELERWTKIGVAYARRLPPKQRAT